MAKNPRTTETSGGRRGRRVVLVGTLLVLASLCTVCMWPALPLVYSPDAFSRDDGWLTEPKVLATHQDGSFLVTVMREGPMSFSSYNRYVGLYTAVGLLRGEIRLGEFGLSFVQWTDEEIVLSTGARRDVDYAAYVRQWTQEARSLGPYSVVVVNP